MLTRPPIATLLLIAAAYVSLPAPHAYLCGSLQQQTGGCPSSGGVTHQDSVDLWATDHRQGHSGDAGDQTEAGSGASVSDPLEQDTTSDPAELPPALQVVRDDYGSHCGTVECEMAMLEVELADLVNFKPSAPRITMEPNGWAVVGLDANFIAESPAQVSSGLLLGYPADVRFVPVQYRWDYGDGENATIGGAGSSWQALGVREFDPTVSSHIFDTSGNYSVGLSVVMTAEYRFAGLGWAPVSGSLSLSAQPLTVLARQATTVLVERNCVSGPTGPGC